MIRKMLTSLTQAQSQVNKFIILIDSVGTGLGSMFNINTMLQNIPQANK